MSEKFSLNEFDGKIAKIASTIRYLTEFHVFLAKMDKDLIQELFYPEYDDNLPLFSDEIKNKLEKVNILSLSTEEELVFKQRFQRLKTICAIDHREKIKISDFKYHIYFRAYQIVAEYLERQKKINEALTLKKEIKKSCQSDIKNEMMKRLFELSSTPEFEKTW